MGIVIKETDAAAVVIKWLGDHYWEVYQEVQMGRGERIADIVATQGKLVWVIECKLALSLSVIEQAEWWRSFAHFSSVATQAIYCRDRARSFARKILRERGLGLFEVGRNEVEAYESPGLNRKGLADQIRRVLHDGMKSYAPAGNAEGKRWTPFGHTCDQVREYVLAHPGATMKDVLDHIDHHYRRDSTARSCLFHWARSGKIRGVMLREEKHSLKFFPGSDRG